MAAKFFIVLCLGVLAVQALPQLQAPIDDVVRDLEDLEREATEQQTEAIRRLGEELGSVDELSQDILRGVGEDLQRATDGLEGQIRDLEEWARQERVDISECVRDAPEEIGRLSLDLNSATGACLNEAHGQAEQAVNDALRKIEEAIGPIDERWREVERCSAAGREEQEICVRALESEIRSAQIEIPEKTRLALEEAIGHLEAEKTSLGLCAAGKVETLNEEGERIVRRVTECAERLIPRQPNPPQF